MVAKKVLAAITAASMIISPTMAVAQAAPIQPASESVEGSELRGGFIIPLIALIAIILGICAGSSVCGADDDDLPHSP